MDFTDPDYKAAVHGVVQGNPGAVETLFALKNTFEASEYTAMVVHLYQRGPRGPQLVERFKDRCQSDALVLGRDLLAQVSEFQGWDSGSNN
jgi:hypothetical protein